MSFTSAWSFLCTPDFAGLVCGVAGTLLLAFPGRWSGWGFVAYLASNVAWLAYAWGRPDMLNLQIQQSVFAVASLVGIWTHLVRDRVRRAALRACVHDTWSMEDDIAARFDGRNARDLASLWDIGVAEVYQILGTRKWGA